VVSSVSCIYGIGNPNDFYESIIHIKKNTNIGRDTLLRHLVDSLYSRNDLDPKRGTFRVKGETVDIFLAHSEDFLRIVFWGDIIEEMILYDARTGNVKDEYDEFIIYPANVFVTSKRRLGQIIEQRIKID
jgi:excinuclease ABC subunit B